MKLCMLWQCLIWLCVTDIAGRMAPEHNVTGGLMAAVGLSADAADARLKKEGLENTVVGCDNSPVNVTLAGTSFFPGQPCLKGPSRHSHGRQSHWPINLCNAGPPHSKERSSSQQSMILS